MNKKSKPLTLTDERLLIIASRALQLTECQDEEEDSKLTKAFYELNDEEYDFLINYAELYPEN